MFRKKKKQDIVYSSYTDSLTFEKMERREHLDLDEALYVIMFGDIFDVWEDVKKDIFYVVISYKEILYIFYVNRSNADKDDVVYIYLGIVVIKNKLFECFNVYELVYKANTPPMFIGNSYIETFYGEKFYNKKVVNGIKLFQCFQSKEINCVNDDFVACFISNIKFIETIKSYEDKENNLLIFSYKEKTYCIVFSNDYKIATYNGSIKMAQIEKYYINSGNKLKCYYANVDNKDEDPFIKYDDFVDVWQLCNFIKENENKFEH